MLEIFRKNLFINSLLLLPYVLVIRMGTFFSTQKYIVDEASNTYFISHVYSYADTGLLQSIIASLIIFIQTLIVNYIFINQKLSKEATQFAGVFYVLFVSLIEESSGLTPILMANTFMLLALLSALKTYKNINATGSIFNCGFMIAMASLFYVPYFIYTVFGLITLLLLRSFNFKEKVQYIIGIITPYFLIFSIKYWYDIAFFEITFFNTIFFRWPEISREQPIIEYLAIGIILMMVVATIVFYGTLVAKKAIQAKKKIDILYWFILFCIVSYLIFNTKIQEHILSLSIPLSLLIAILASESKNKLFYELLHLMLIIIVFMSQFNLLNF